MGEAQKSVRGRLDQRELELHQILKSVSGHKNSRAGAQLSNHIVGLLSWEKG